MAAADSARSTTVITCGGVVISSEEDEVRLRVRDEAGDCGREIVHGARSRVVPASILGKHPRAQVPGCALQEGMFSWTFPYKGAGENPCQRQSGIAPVAAIADDGNDDCVLEFR